MVPIELSELDCSVARTLDLVGDRWSILILRDAFYGVRRFEDFQHDLGIARNVLAARLKKFVESGVMERRAYQDRPPRYEYRLTPKGRELLPVMLAMMAWGDKWTSEGEPPVTLTHVPCDHTLAPVVACSHCGDEIRLHEVHADPLPVRPRVAS
ncbi:MAG TPA: helix-turn-helix domain-containing protein [Actinomycetota bacterium]|nr:helix-turn-helix domain-containing protein [Actinomycetota bacterium]